MAAWLRRVRTVTGDIHSRWLTVFWTRGPCTTQMLIELPNLQDFLLLIRRLEHADHQLEVGIAHVVPLVCLTIPKPTPQSAVRLCVRALPIASIRCMEAAGFTRRSNERDAEGFLHFARYTEILAEL